MKDIITFRGKRISDGQWVYGGRLSEDVIVPCGQLFSVHNNRCDLNVYEVDKNTVSMSTGVFDKNDKLIYEGDILQFGSRKLVVFWNGESLQWFARTYNNKDYPIICGPGTYGEWNYIELGEIAAEDVIVGTTSREIIGNVFDNPEEGAKEIYDCEHSF